MKRKNLGILLFVLSLFLLSSCGRPVMDFELAGALKKGQDKEKIADYFNRDPEIETNFTVDGFSGKIEVEIYRRWIWASDLKPIVRDKYDLLIFAYENKKLVYWGSLDDFKREADPKVAKLGQTIGEYLVKEF